MDNHPQLEEAKRIVAEAAESYHQTNRPILEVLGEFRESITMLRSKGASFATIAEVLRKANIVVSPATLGRFCKTLPGLTPPRSRRRKRTTKPSRQSRSVSKAVSPASIAPQSSTDSDGGPRIPNIETL